MCGMRPPLVAVTAANAPDSRGFDRASLNLSYLRALEQAGALPLIVSPGMPPELLADAITRCSGLVLTGGGDVAPERYGGDPDAPFVGVSQLRDELEFAALDIAAERGLPILAICRGMQVLNIWLGGKLIEDIPSMVPGACGHSVQQPRHGAAHDVALEPGCRTRMILGGAMLGVNSRHHQAIRPDALGEGLVVTGRAPDGVIEAVELTGERFVVGVQWHPEDMATGLEDSPERRHARALFEAFAAEARSFAAKA